MTTHVLAELDRERYVALTTFRRDGRPVTTPIWFAVDGDVVVAYSEADAGKVKRIRATGRVAVQACDVRGRVRSGAPSLQGTGRVLDVDESARAEVVLARKYGLVKRAFEVVSGLWQRVRRRPDRPTAYLAIRLDT
jgi:PPOX class probable F420-dependent enzyme